MGIKTKKHRGGLQLKSQEVDWGYKGEYEGKNCFKLKDEADSLNCAKKKFFYHCGAPKGKEFCANPPSKDDKQRQNFYRKIIMKDCEEDPLLCSKTDTDGSPKEQDDMCVYVNVCDDGMPLSHVLPTITNVYGDFKGQIDEIFGDWKEMAKGKNYREKEFKKKQIKKIKSQMKKIKDEYNATYGNSENKIDNSEFGDEDSQTQAENDMEQEQAGGDDENEGPTTKEKYSESEGAKCQKKVKSGKNPFKSALGQYNNYLQEKEALKNAGTSITKSRERDARASLVIKGKIKGLEDCLNELSIGSLSGLKIFEKYLNLDKKLAKYQNRKSIKRIGKAFGNISSKYKSVKAQRQSMTEGAKRKMPKKSKKKKKEPEQDDSEFD